MPRKSTVIARPLLIFVPGCGRVITAPPAASTESAANRHVAAITARERAQAPNRKHLISHKDKFTNSNDGIVTGASVWVLEGLDIGKKLNLGLWTWDIGPFTT